MWFADTGQGLSWALLALWLLAAALVVVGSRAGSSALGRILPPAVRPPIAVGTGVAAALVAVQAGLVDTVADAGGPGLLDRSVLAWFVGHRSDPVTTIMTAVSAVGGTAGMAVLAVAAAAVLWWARRRWEAGVVLVATAGAGALVPAFKNLYDRARPPLDVRLTVETNAALPSGHALGSMVVLGVLAAVVVIATRRTAVQVTAIVVAAAGIVAIGISWLYLGVHWTTDVLTGWSLGAAWLAVCVTALTIAPHTHRGRITTPKGTDRDPAVPATAR